MAETTKKTTTTAAKTAKPAAAKTAAAPKKVAVKPVEAKKVETKKVEVKKAAAPKATGKIRVTMIHGLGSCTQRQIKTAKALKLARPGDTRELPNLPSVLGACKKLEHLVKVENI